MQSIFEGSKSCFTAFLASARCANLKKKLPHFSSVIWGKGKKAAGTLAEFVFVIRHQQLRASSQALETEDQVFKMEKKVKTEIKEEIQRGKQRVIALPGRDDCTSGNSFQKAAGIRRSLCLGLQINKEKTIFTLFSTILLVKIPHPS